MKKSSFTKLVKENIVEYSFNGLLEMKASHSKLDNLEYDELTRQPYIEDEDITTTMAQNIFKYRTRMLKFKDNFKGTEISTECPLCEKHVDSQHEVENCKKLSESIDNLEECKKLYNESNNIVASKILEKVVKYRESFLADNKKD